MQYASLVYGWTPLLNSIGLCTVRLIHSNSR